MFGGGGNFAYFTHYVTTTGNSNGAQALLATPQNFSASLRMYMACTKFFLTKDSLFMVDNYN